MLQKVRPEVLWVESWEIRFELWSGSLMMIEFGSIFALSGKEAKQDAKF